MTANAAKQVSAAKARTAATGRKLSFVNSTKYASCGPALQQTQRKREPRPRRVCPALWHAGR